MRLLRDLVGSRALNEGSCLDFFVVVVVVS